VIAALFVEKNGVYYGLDDVDPWDEERDARLYAGPWPVVAHPPCGPWGRLRKFSKEDPELARIAVRMVREYGGVLEHPAGSLLWDENLMPRPGEFPDNRGGMTYEVDQVHWGHRCKKATWLYCVGTEPPGKPPFPDAQPTRSIQTRQRHPKRLPEVTKKERRATPIPFRDLLLNMARSIRQGPELCGQCRCPPWSLQHYWTCGWRDRSRGYQGQSEC